MNVCQKVQVQLPCQHYHGRFLESLRLLEEGHLIIKNSEYDMNKQCRRHSRNYRVTACFIHNVHHVRVHLNVSLKRKMCPFLQDELFSTVEHELLTTYRIYKEYLLANFLMNFVFSTKHRGVCFHKLHIQFIGLLVQCH